MHLVENKEYKIKKSVDNGQTWTDHTGELNNQLVYNLKFASDSRVLAATQSGVYRSSSQTLINISGNNLPDKFLLKQNYPNPFNPNTKINFSVPVNSLVTLKIYDVLGKEVMTLINEQKPAGNYAAEFNGANLSSGIYFFRMEAGEFIDVKRMMMIK